MNRIDFIKISSIFATSAFIPFSHAVASQREFRVGLIGTPGMGWANFNAILKSGGLMTDWGVHLSADYHNDYELPIV